MCFNSQPRKGADRKILISVNLLCVSTHSPARGLTILNDVIRNKKDVSTHSPARGLTIKDRVSNSPRRSFNSQPRKGADGSPNYIRKYYWTFQLTAPQGG